MSEFEAEMLKILFWNSRSVRNKKEEIAKIVTKYRHHSKGGGILILIRNYLAYHEIANLNSPAPSVEIAGICITNVKFPIELIACYKVPNCILSQIQWDEILRNVSHNKYTVLM